MQYPEIFDYEDKPISRQQIGVPIICRPKNNIVRAWRWTEQMSLDGLSLRITAAPNTSRVMLDVGDYIAIDAMGNVTYYGPEDFAALFDVEPQSQALTR